VIGGDGCIEVQTRRVPLPAERGDGVALAQEPCVAEVGNVFGIRGAAIDNAQEAFAAAVGDFQQQRAVGAMQRSHEKQVGGEFDFALCVAWRFIKVDNAAVVRVVGADGEVHTGVDLIVRGDSLPFDANAAADFHTGDAGEGGSGGGGQGEQEDCAAAECHCRAV
jgi:hypothetical protein